MARTGRPTDYSQELSDAMCEHLASGKSLLSWCSKPGNPSYNTVARWLRDDEEFREKYVRAREAQADYLAEEVVEIADKVRNAVKKTVSGSGEKQHIEEVHLDAVERSRLMMDARKWYAAKLAPRKYGEKLGIGGADGLPPVQTESKVDYDGATVETVRAIAALRLKPD